MEFRRTAARIGAVAAIVGGMAIGVAGPAVQASTFPGYSGRILFTRSPDANTTDPRVWTMLPDGTDQVALPTSTRSSYGNWSADGTKIVYVGWPDPTNQPNNADIYVIDAAGTGETQLTNDPAYDGYPSFAPNGKIVFSSLRGGNSDIYVMDADGSNVTQLTSDKADDFWPQVSPDGTKVLFVSQRNGAKNQVFVMNIDGSGQTQVSPFAEPSQDAKWSPDGTKVIWATEHFTPGTGQLVVSNPDGSGVTQLTNEPLGVNQGVFSPDGTQIAYQSQKDGNNDIWVMGADGSNPVKLTATAPQVEGRPNWQPLAQPLPTTTTTAPTTTAPVAPVTVTPSFTG